MKKWLVLLWLLVPVALVSYHFSAGVEAIAWREADEYRRTAKDHEAAGQWEPAIEAYQQALNAMPATADADPASREARDQMRLAQIRARFQLGRLDETVSSLRAFLDEVEQTHGPRSDTAYDARDLLGRVHFQTMVAMRLESAEAEVWKRQWELSRQNFRYLAERTDGPRNALDRKNLEVVIKSADLPVLALPPPPTGGAGGGGATALAPPIVPPPPTDAAAAPVVTDARPRAAADGKAAVTPPEFDLGS